MGRQAALALSFSLFLSHSPRNAYSFGPLGSSRTTAAGCVPPSSSSTVLHEKKQWTTSLFPATPPPSSSSASAGSELIPAATKTQIDPPPDRGFGPTAYQQTLAGLIGIVVGLSVAGFKLAIEMIREICYYDLVNYIPIFLIPVLGGIAVSVLAYIGDGEFPPGVSGVVSEVDRDAMNMNQKSKLSELGDSFRKAWAAIFTLGTGCSLGPEGPGVEIGIAVSRLGTLAWPEQFDRVTDDDVVNTAARVRRNRLYLACGAAAGVSSGFNAPLSGVFFALEVIQRNLPATSIPAPAPIGMPEAAEASSFELRQESLTAETGSITSLLTSSVLSALISRAILGNELALGLMDYEIQTPLLELPLYLILGLASGVTAVAFSQAATLAKSSFDSIDELPSSAKPVLGGLICGVTGLACPQILFFGYETLNGLLQNNSLPTDVVLTLLAVKIFTTAVSAGSGLVGGLLAPSLFMGGMVGASFHNIVIGTLEDVFHVSTEYGSFFVLADVPAYAIVGAASTLAAIFRAPLTASLLAFELTRDYDILLPLIASAGAATLICELVEEKVEASNQ